MMSQCYRMCRTIIRNQPSRIISQSNIYFSKDPQKICVRTLCMHGQYGHTKPSITTLRAYCNNFLVVPGRRPGSFEGTSLQVLCCRTASSNQSTVKDKTDIEVYYGNLTSQIRAVKFFSLVTSITGLAAQPLLLQKASELNNLGAGIAVGAFIGFFTFITPFLLHWITKKYITHLHYCPETKKYTATTLSLLLLKKKTIFSATDVTVPDMAGMFTTFTVNNGTALFVDPRLFKHPEHYARIMGFDKPLDFKLEPLDSEPEDKKSAPKS